MLADLFTNATAADHWRAAAFALCAAAVPLLVAFIHNRLNREPK